MMHLLRFCAIAALVGPLSAVAADVSETSQNSTGASASDEPRPLPSGDGELYELKYRFTPGEAVRYQVTHEANIETTIAGTSQTADMVSKSVKRWDVQDTDPAGQSVFEHSVESIDMLQAISGRKEIRYNSEKDTEVPADYAEAAKAVGVPLAVITVDDSGNVVHRVQKNVQRVGNASEGQILYTLPSKPIAVGHVWTVPQAIDVKLENGGTKKVRVRQRFELESVSHDGIATIRLETQVLDVMDDPKVEVQLVQRLTKGSIRFDINAGRLIEQDLKLDQQVIGFSGPSSSMRLVGSFTEQLLPSEAVTAAPAKVPREAAKARVQKAPTAKSDHRASPGQQHPLRRSANTDQRSSKNKPAARR